MGQADEDYRPYDGTDYTAGEVPEVGRELLCRLPIEGAAECLPDILERPPRYDRIEAEDEEGCQYAIIAYPLPLCPRRELLEGSGSIAPGVAADEELCYHDGQAQEGCTYKEDEEEGATSVLPHHIGESPYTTQADGTAYRRQDYSYLTAKGYSLFIHSLHY